MPHVERAQGRLYYEWRRGPENAPETPVLLIRGLARSSRYWLGFADRLTTRWDVLLFDNRGLGQSPDAGHPFRIRHLADDVVAILDAAGVKKAHVFGLSLGGMVAQEMAIRYSDRIDRLVLGATTPGPRYGRRPSPRTVATLLAANTFPGLVGRRVEPQLVLNRLNGSAREALLKQWAQLWEERRAPRWTVFRQLIAAQLHDAYDRLPEIRAPTLCLAGTHDRLMPPENSRIIAGRIPRAKVVELEGCGHDFPSDDVDETFRIVDAFYQGKRYCL